MPFRAPRRTHASPATPSIRLNSLEGGTGHLPDLSEPGLHTELVKAADRQRHEHPDALFQHAIGVPERHRDFGRRPRDLGRVVNAPMRRHWMPRPDRTRFAGRVITDREHEIDRWRTRGRELGP